VCSLEKKVDEMSNNCALFVSNEKDGHLHSVGCAPVPSIRPILNGLPAQTPLELEAWAKRLNQDRHCMEDAVRINNYYFLLYIYMYENNG